MKKRMITMMMMIEHWIRVDGEYREYWIIVMSYFWKVMKIWHLDIMMRRRRKKKTMTTLRKTRKMESGWMLLVRREMRIMFIGMIMMIP